MLPLNVNDQVEGVPGALPNTNPSNIDGDNPAASRYTEARMTAVAEAMLEGLNENAVDFRENYDGTLSEPVVLPATFPNLLANGSSGIAVGMATNIPPHNIVELVDACLHLIKTPDAKKTFTHNKHRPTVANNRQATGDWAGFGM